GPLVAPQEGCPDGPAPSPQTTLSPFMTVPPGSRSRSTGGATVRSTDPRSPRAAPPAPASHAPDATLPPSTGSPTPTPAPTQRSVVRAHGYGPRPATPTT